ncbi:hypothetical protein [uncultured Aliiroseovarius sp.]|uniref:hypothetical protein n=1 Tax=uncultured Aliiroseovarius sp. TaxID=1658783 RepID=UPI00262DFA8D|nr:hypothetical protein [uncultured Aliiroseovarius sp.]
MGFRNGKFKFSLSYLNLLPEDAALWAGVSYTDMYELLIKQIGTIELTQILLPNGTRIPGGQNGASASATDVPVTFSDLRPFAQKELERDPICQL